MSEIFFQGFWRMDWGLGNPNKTAALIAALMIAVWALAYLRNWLFWISLGLFSALGVCLVHTFSRGGMVAAFCGLIPLLACLRRPLPVKRIVGVVAAVWVIVGASIYLQAHERFGQGVVHEDRSISNRLILWKATPTMMVDAPDGWGIGQSGKSYMEWYQPLDRTESYRTLVSSHLTWLVEFGWIGRFLYIFGWILVIILCAPSKRQTWTVIPFGIWICFFVAALFSSVAESLVLWILPGGALLSMVIWRVRYSQWPNWKALAFAPLAAGATLAVLPLAVTHSTVRKAGPRITIGGQNPSIWVVVDPKVLGENYGRTLRSHNQSNRNDCVGVVESVVNLPIGKLRKVIFTGDGGSRNTKEGTEKLRSAERLVFVNPLVLPEDLSLTDSELKKATLSSGEFAEMSKAKSWPGVLETKQLNGVGDFVPDWPARLLKDQ